MEAGCTEHVLLRSVACRMGIQVCAQTRMNSRRPADEARVVLDGPSHHRTDIGDEPVGHATPAQKYIGNLAARLVDGVDADVDSPLWTIASSPSASLRVEQVKHLVPFRNQIPA